MILIPNRYLSNEKDVWKLKYILGENLYNSYMDKYDGVIDDVFIYNAFLESTQTFYISSKIKRIYSFLNERNKHIDDILEIPLVLLLKYIDVNQIEEVIEKTYVNYETTYISF